MAHYTMAVTPRRTGAHAPILLLAGLLGCLSATARAAEPEPARPVVPRPREVWVAPLQIRTLYERGQVTLGAYPPARGKLLDVYDVGARSGYRATEPGPARLEFVFTQPQLLREVEVRLPKGRYRWSAVAAQSLEALDRADETRTLVPERDAAARIEAVPLAKPEPVRALRLTLIPPEGKRAELQGLSLIAEQVLEGVRLEPPSAIVRRGEEMELPLWGLYSGGYARVIRDADVRWSWDPPQNVQIQDGYVSARREGPFQVRAEYRGFTTHTLVMEVGDRPGPNIGIGIGAGVGIGGRRRRTGIGIGVGF